MVQKQKMKSEYFYLDYSIPQAVYDSLSEILTNREIQCLILYVNGLSSREIASMLDISYRTVENYVQNCKGKLHLSTKAELILKVFQIQS